MSNTFTSYNPISAISQTFTRCFSSHSVRTQLQPPESLMDQLHEFPIISQAIPQFRFLKLINYNLTDNPFRPSCGQAIEPVEHYFLECASSDSIRPRTLTNPFKLGSSSTVDNASEIINFNAHGSTLTAKNRRSVINCEKYLDALKSFLAIQPDGF